MVALFTRLFRFPQLNTNTEMAKLIWLVRLRWVAITLFFTLAAPALVYRLLNSTTLPIYMAVITILLLINLLTQLIFISPKKSVGPLFICFQLTIDLLSLTILLSVSGGFANPLTGLFLLNVSLGAVLISRNLGWPFLLMAHTLIVALQINEIRLGLANLVFFSYIIFSHGLVFLFWMVLRSLGVYLEKQGERQAQIRVQLERQDRLRALGSLTAGFSHEFASPLNAAKLRIERIKRTSATVISEDIEVALDSIKACEQVIHQMNSSQMDARDFQTKTVNMKDLLNDIADSWKEENREAILNVQIQSEDFLKIPPVNLAQVVLNLLDNAYEEAPTKEIKLSFFKNETSYVLSVEDLGRGFSEKILRSIGEPFLTTKENGTGLGLYVTQLFTQSLGGEMKLMNTPGAGGKVALSWPMTQIGNI